MINRTWLGAVVLPVVSLVAPLCAQESAAWRDPSPHRVQFVTVDDSVRLALLVVLRRLSPAERVVFVLHDIFGVPFGSIAQTVGRPEPSCRQLARRARQKIADSQGGDTFGCFNAAVVATDPAKAAGFLDRACQRGDGEACRDLGCAMPK